MATAQAPSPGPTAQPPAPDGPAPDGQAEPGADIVVDARGLLCPMPVVRTAKAAKQLQPGQVLKLLATDPGSIADIPAWAETTGNRVVTWRQAEGAITFWVRKEA